jgi:hypothetical protein
MDLGLILGLNNGVSEGEASDSIGCTIIDLHLGRSEHVHHDQAYKGGACGRSF